jgi:hypothetical protein
LLKGSVGGDNTVGMIYQQERLLMSIDDRLNRKGSFSHVFFLAVTL